MNISSFQHRNMKVLPNHKLKFHLTNVNNLEDRNSAQTQFEILASYQQEDHRQIIFYPTKPKKTHKR